MVSSHREVLVAAAITLLLFIGACRSLQPVVSSNTDHDCDILFSITITANDLSEDLTIFSTDNDECILFVYPVNDSLTADTLLIMEQFQPGIKKKPSTFTTQKEWCKSYPQLMIVLVEMDTERSAKEIEPQVRRQLKKLNSTYTQERLTQGRDVLGDDDLLGARLVNTGNKKESEFTIEGVHATDLYNYHIKLDWTLVKKHKH